MSQNQRFLFVRNLPYKATPEELYELFGKFGGVRQIRQGNAQDTRGTAFVVYNTVEETANALKSLQGFQIQGRYLVLVYHDPSRKPKRK
ncbi:MAG: hypothetical protein SGCHY_001443 [Lobulomycetales sp.]